MDIVASVIAAVANITDIVIVRTNFATPAEFAADFMVRVVTFQPLTALAVIAIKIAACVVETINLPTVSKIARTEGNLVLGRAFETTTKELLARFSLKH